MIVTLMQSKIILIMILAEYSQYLMLHRRHNGALEIVPRDKPYSQKHLPTLRIG